jgi:predicted adenylyl cyclase CyaB
MDEQIDTYFAVPSGKLKLRQGPIENSLIYYQRPQDNQPKRSEVYLERLSPDNSLEHLLAPALGILCKVEKKRHIFFIGKVKFHIDEVPGLGSFVEIEAIGNPGEDSESEIRSLCNDYMKILEIQAEDMSLFVFGSGFISRFGLFKMALCFCK